MTPHQERVKEMEDEMLEGRQKMSSREYQDARLKIFEDMTTQLNTELENLRLRYLTGERA